MYFNFDPDGCQPTTNTRGVGIYISKRISVLEYHSQAPAFKNIFGSQFRSKVVIIYSLGVSIEAHLLSY